MRLAENNEEFRLISFRQLVDNAADCEDLAVQLRALADELETWHAEGFYILDFDESAVLLTNRQRYPEEM